MSKDIDEYNIDYLMRINNTLNKALNCYPRVTVIRTDLHFPPIDNQGDMPTCFIDMQNAISRFIESLNRKLKHDNLRRGRQNKRIFPNRLRYVWVREQAVSELPHYHCALILNKDAYYHLGDYNLAVHSLRTMITTAWYSALRLELDPIRDTGTLVHYPENGRYCLNQHDLTFQADREELMRRLSYLAKEHSKHYSMSSRSIGYSLS